MKVTETTEEIIEGVGAPVRAAEIESRTAAETVDYSMPDCVEALRRIGVFADLPREQLEWFIENADEKEFNAGDVAFRKGDLPDWMFIYLEGEVHARRDENNLDDYVYIARAGDSAVVVDCKNCVVLADKRPLAVVGLTDVVVVDSGDAVLVVPKDKSQDVRKVVEALKARKMTKFL